MCGPSEMLVTCPSLVMLMYLKAQGYLLVLPWPGPSHWPGLAWEKTALCHSVVFASFLKHWLQRCLCTKEKNCLSAFMWLPPSLQKHVSYTTWELCDSHLYWSMLFLLDRFSAGQLVLSSPQTPLQFPEQMWSTDCRCFCWSSFILSLVICLLCWTRLSSGLVVMATFGSLSI